MQIIRWLSLSTCLSTCLALGGVPTMDFARYRSSDLLLADQWSTHAVLVDGQEFWSVLRAAGDLVTDFGRVTGSDEAMKLVVSQPQDHTGLYEYYRPTNLRHFETEGPFYIHGPEFSSWEDGHEVSHEVSIIAGTLGASRLIDNLVGRDLLNVSQIEGQWEAYTSQIIDDPFPNVKRALVVAGSDKRGTIYGLYDISEQIGVSPFHYWSDSVPQNHLEVYAVDTVKVQGTPSVKYRGFFINDEAPGLANWAEQNFGRVEYGTGFVSEFYEHVFELLLRLRGNYLWPAMWASMFFVDDALNQPTADAYGVVMGTSHTEPLLRTKEEWVHYGDGEWQWLLNNETIAEFMEYGVQRAAPYEGIYNLAIRGFDDSEMLVEPDKAVDLLHEVVDVQRDMLERIMPDKNITDIPQMWCLYKEVQGYFEGGMSVPDDVILLWSDDNYGNVRRLPVGNETDRVGGAGLYYHFEYLGVPRGYKWQNTASYVRAIEQLHLTYANKADKLWIVNVGDIKPLETPLNFFMDAAYDINRWTVANVDEWMELWAAREFGAHNAAETADILQTFARYTSWRRFELVDATTFSVVNYNEAERVLALWEKLADRAQALHDSLSPEMQPSFYETVLYAVKAGYVVNAIHLNTALNNVYADQKRSVTNDLAFKVLDYFANDSLITDEFHALRDGRWNHMMDQTHLGFIDYHQQPMRNAIYGLGFVQSQRSALPSSVAFTAEGNFSVVPGDDRFHWYKYGMSVQVPELSPFGEQHRYVDVFSRGNEATNWTMNSTSPFIRLSHTHGTTGGTTGRDYRVYISVDWDLVDTTEPFTAVVQAYLDFPEGVPHNWVGTSRERLILIDVPIHKTAAPGFVGFVESDGHIAIEAEHTSRQTAVEDSQYIVIPNLGYTLSGLTLSPFTTPSRTPDESPRLEYDFYSFTDRDAPANITLYLAPSLNYRGDSDPLKYAIAVDDAEPQIVQYVPNGSGINMPEGWLRAVSDNVWHSSTLHDIAPGSHTLSLWALQPSVVFERIIVDFGGVRTSYFGPPESEFVDGPKFTVQS